MAPEQIEPSKQMEGEGKKLPILPEIYSSSIEQKQARLDASAEIAQLVAEDEMNEKQDRENNPAKYVKQLLSDLGYKPGQIERVLKDENNPYRIYLDTFVQDSAAMELDVDPDQSKEKGYPVLTDKDGKGYIPRGVAQALKFHSAIEKDLKKLTSDFDYEFVLNVAAAKSSQALDDYTYSLAVGRSVSFWLRGKVVEDLKKLSGKRKEKDDVGDQQISAADVDVKYGSNKEEIEYAEERRKQRNLAVEEYTQTYMKEEVENGKRLGKMLDDYRKLQESGQEISHEDYMAVGAEYDQAMKDFAMKNPQYAGYLEDANNIVDTYLEMKAGGASREDLDAFVKESGIQEMARSYDDPADVLYYSSGDASKSAAMDYIEALIEGKAEFMVSEYSNEGEGDL